MHRLQVILSHHGVASRRYSAELIQSGHVTVNGILVTEPGARVDPATARISVDGIPLNLNDTPATRTIMLNKPRGLICSATDDLGPTVFECLRDIPERIVPVGRLDKDSEGLLLLSNDGELIHTLTHPRFGHRKEYIVTVRGTITGDTLKTLRSPMTLEDDGTQLNPVEVDLLDNDLSKDPPRHRLRMILSEGRNRQIRRMCDQVGLYVERLIRMAIDDLRLPFAMPVGAWRDLTPPELDALRKTYSALTQIPR